MLALCTSQGELKILSTEGFFCIMIFMREKERETDEGNNSSQHKQSDKGTILFRRRSTPLNITINGLKKKKKSMTHLSLISI